jgi:hypothetical protein
VTAAALMPEPQESPRELIERAVLTLAGQCDHARTEDGVGFNRWDAGWGHGAAESIQRGEGIPLERALRVVTKYRGQLERVGIMLPTAEMLDAERPARVELSGGVNTRASSVEITQFSKSSLAVRFPYDVAKVEAVRSLPNRKWEGASRSWLVPASDLEKVLAIFPDAKLPGAIAEALAAKRAELATAEETRKATVAEDIARYESLLPTLGRTPFAHQDAGMRWLIEQRFAILADDMGLGKTMQALVAARALGHRIFVIAPAGLRINWLREARAVDARIEVFSWAKVPEPLGIAYTLIADEAHYAQNMKAARTKKFIELAKGARAVFALTGTPIKNGRPTNLFPLLVATKHDLARDRKGYERRYCNAGPTRWTKWDVTGASHLDELHGRIADRLLRRMKDECLDLPAKTRVIREAELSAEAVALYNQTLREMQAEYRRRKMTGEIDEADALVLMNHLRHASSVAKVESAIEIAEEVIEQGGQIVLFTAFLDSAAKLQQHLEAELITGAQGADERQASIDRFQAGESKAMVCTLGAGNVGITLTAAQTVVLVDRPWTPGDAMQAEDRLHRIGQRSSVTAIWLQANEMDRTIDELLGEKYERIEMVLAGEARELPAVRSVTDVAREILGGE